ncbi:hypothetical protein FHS78_002756 [Parvibaculum indicum]|uniref:hypothetical protein n=1 Tax=Parvibaculum indicum TaxID=562969 RepID=UPI00141F1930|nr:hypothetical protein [Parvibaculum indicum]NIJ42454.1 hypothetical protein [Parvibaculum indicum]
MKISVRLFVLFALLSLFACEEWGTMDEAEAIFHAHEKAFETLDRELIKNPKFKYITEDFTPEKGNMHLNKQYGPLSSEDKAAYTDIVRQMAKIDVQSVDVFRSEESPENETALGWKNVRLVKFLIFGHGFGGSTEGIWIVKVSTNARIEDFYSPANCKPVRDPNWYLCRSG